VVRNETALVFSAILLFVPAALLVIWLLPQWQVAQIPEVVLERNSTRYFEIQDEARRTLAQVILGVFSAFILFLTWRRARAADETLKVAREQHVTDRLSKAIEQLGASEETRPVVEIRIGAIYALERLSMDSPRDYWAIVNILGEYLSQHARPENLQATTLKTFLNTNFIRSDLKASLTVLGRRRDPSPCLGFRLRLVNCYLPWTTIAGNFERTDMVNCDFSRGGFLMADFSLSSIGRVDFRNCELYRVKFDHTNQGFVSYEGSKMEGVSFCDATLSRVDFRGAACLWVDFRGAKLAFVNIAGCDLSTSFGITAEMLEGTIGDDKTVLPAGLSRPTSWSHPEPNALWTLRPLDPAGQ
jgi:uncharacterized protein YjbI with pentapeptide repeats